MTDAKVARLTVGGIAIALLVLTIICLYQADVIDIQRAEMRKLSQQNTEYANQIVRNHCQDPTPPSTGPAKVRYTF